ncbi:signal recognition particle protein [Candidatus Woesearchaeota archaeon]|jgi:signal recognition particle subunit SRP54|nr:signal recognition particle protein [Candidatus Woesearchaeota archaeon]MBT6520149.1 signal recognition particle protein [Candidatus Woesearchaeota archaeon]MBT7366754.1 signal recognition particle protein [Candidatus Woesearchaeota archaeon]
MVLEKLGSSLKNTLSKISKAVFVDEKLINELVKDIQRALLHADVNVKMVFKLSKQIKDRILKEDTPSGLTKKEFLIKIVYEELVNFLGEHESKIEIKKKPTTIMLVGLFGHGKTTTSGKLAKYYQKRGHKVALISTDTWRPAAFKQLEQLGSQIKVPVFGNPQLGDPVKIYKEFEDELKKFDIVIVDTAGRDALSDDLIEELNQISKTVNADERLLIIGGDVGQAAEKQAQTFHDTCNVTGVVMTKLEGTAKGGGSLAACSVTGAKVKFIGVGEKIDDLETFSPERFVGKLLGMGDLEGLLEKARDAISDDEAQDMSKKLVKGEFNLIDLHDQMKAMSKMGSLGKIMDMIPGFGQFNIPKDMLKGQEDKLEIWKYIMSSMTKEELEDPEAVMTPGRVARIAKGSGTTVSEVRELVKQYRQSKKLMKAMSGKAGSPDQMEKMVKRMGPGGLLGGMKGMKGMGKMKRKVYK